ncbi:MAG: aspartate aminotransferase family protein [Chlamydiia bacterium]|nr:aspartate aminotransferase family protein [Chlamydiia bacterium]
MPLTLAVAGFSFATGFFLQRCFSQITLKKVIEATPVVNSQLDNQLKKVQESAKRELFTNTQSEDLLLELPETGFNARFVIGRLENVRGNTDSEYQTGAIYENEPDIDRLIVDVFEKTMRTNPMHPNCPRIKQMENQVISMVGKMFGDDNNVRGNITTGGTMSNVHAVYTAREHARVNGVKDNWCMIFPESAHPSFDKAAHWLGIKPIKVKTDPKTGKADVNEMEGLLANPEIRKRTIMVVGSAPGFAHGVIDPIQKISDMLERVDPKNNILFHVDSCLGGFIVPFMEKAGYTPDEKFGFNITSRMTSVSADTHKYGSDTKGSSTIVYRNEKIYKHQIWAMREWDGGFYGTPTLEGSRDGTVPARVWAVMAHIGEKGYVERTKKILSTAKQLREAIKEINELELAFETNTMVVSFKSTNSDVNIFDVIDEMCAVGNKNGRHWYISGLQKPDAAHMVVTNPHTRNNNFVNVFKQDLKSAVDQVKTYTKDKRGKSSRAKMYGSNASFIEGPFVTDGIRAHLLGLSSPTPQLTS